MRQNSASSRRPVTSTLISAVLLLLTGCSTETAGSPSPATPRNSVPASSSSPARGDGGSLADFDTCALLNEVASAQNITEIEADGDTACAGFLPNRVAVNISYHTDIGIAKAGQGPYAEVSDMTVGSRKAKLIEKAVSTTSCAVAMEVTESSRFDVATSGDSLEQSCDAATSFAKAVEAKIPAS